MNNLSLCSTHILVTSILVTSCILSLERASSDSIRLNHLWSSPFAESLLLLKSLDHHVFEFVVLELAVPILVVVFHDALDVLVTHVVVDEHFFDLVHVDRPALVLVQLIEDPSQLVLAQEDLDVQGSGHELGVVDKAIFILVDSFE